jgi:hypothetical protein
MTLEIVELSDFMGNPRLALSFICSLCDYQGGLIRFERFLIVEFHQLLRFLNMNLNELFANELHHLSPLFFIVQGTSIIKRFL